MNIYDKTGFRMKSKKELSPLETLEQEIVQEGKKIKTELSKAKAPDVARSDIESALVEAKRLKDVISEKKRQAAELIAQNSAKNDTWRKKNSPSLNTLEDKNTAYTEWRNNNSATEATIQQHLQSLTLYDEEIKGLAKEIAENKNKKNETDSQKEARIKGLGERKKKAEEEQSKIASQIAAYNDSSAMASREDEGRRLALTENESKQLAHLRQIALKIKAKEEADQAKEASIDSIIKRVDEHLGEMELILNPPPVVAAPVTETPPAPTVVHRRVAPTPPSAAPETPPPAASTHRWSLLQNPWVKSVVKIAVAGLAVAANHFLPTRRQETQTIAGAVTAIGIVAADGAIGSGFAPVAGAMFGYTVNNAVVTSERPDFALQRTCERYQDELMKDPQAYDTVLMQQAEAFNGLLNHPQRDPSLLGLMVGVANLYCDRGETPYYDAANVRAQLPCNDRAKIEKGMQGLISQDPSGGIALINRFFDNNGPKLTDTDIKKVRERLQFEGAEPFVEALIARAIIIRDTERMLNDGADVCDRAQNPLSFQDRAAVMVVGAITGGIAYALSNNRPVTVVEDGLMSVGVGTMVGDPTISRLFTTILMGAVQGSGYQSPFLNTLVQTVLVGVLATAGEHFKETIFPSLPVVDYNKQWACRVEEYYEMDAHRELVRIAGDVYRHPATPKPSSEIVETVREQLLAECHQSPNHNLTKLTYGIVLRGSCAESDEKLEPLIAKLASAENLQPLFDRVHNAMMSLLNKEKDLGCPKTPKETRKLQAAGVDPSHVLSDSCTTKKIIDSSRLVAYSLHQKDSRAGLGDPRTHITDANFPLVHILAELSAHVILDKFQANKATVRCANKKAPFGLPTYASNVLAAAFMRRESLVLGPITQMVLDRQLPQRGRRR